MRFIGRKLLPMLLLLFDIAGTWSKDNLEVDVVTHTSIGMCDASGSWRHSFGLCGWLEVFVDDVEKRVWGGCVLRQLPHHDSAVLLAEFGLARHSGFTDVVEGEASIE